MTQDETRRTVRLVSCVNLAEADELRAFAWEQRTPLSVLIRETLLAMARQDQEAA